MSLVKEINFVGLGATLARVAVRLFRLQSKSDLLEDEPGGRLVVAVSCISIMEATKIIYHVGDENIPYLVKVPPAARQVRLADFKNLIPQYSDKYKFYFKSIDEDVGVVKEEIMEDGVTLPVFNGLIMSWLVPVGNQKGSLSATGNESHAELNPTKSPSQILPGRSDFRESFRSSGNQTGQPTAKEAAGNSQPCSSGETTACSTSPMSADMFVVAPNNSQTSLPDPRLSAHGSKTSLLGIVGTNQLETAVGAKVGDTSKKKQGNSRNTSNGTNQQEPHYGPTQQQTVSLTKQQQMISNNNGTKEQSECDGAKQPLIALKQPLANNGANQSPANNGAKQLPANNGAKQLPANNGAKQLPANNGAKQPSASNGNKKNNRNNETEHQKVESLPKQHQKSKNGNSLTIPSSEADWREFFEKAVVGTNSIPDTSNTSDIFKRLLKLSTTKAPASENTVVVSEVSSNSINKTRGTTEAILSSSDAIQVNGKEHKLHESEAGLELEEIPFKLEIKVEETDDEVEQKKIIKVENANLVKSEDTNNVAAGGTAKGKATEQKHQQYVKSGNKENGTERGSKTPGKVLTHKEFGTAKKEDKEQTVKPISDKAQLLGTTLKSRLRNGSSTLQPRGEPQNKNSKNVDHGTAFPATEKNRENSSGNRKTVPLAPVSCAPKMLQPPYCWGWSLPIPGRTVPVSSSNGIPEGAAMATTSSSNDPSWYKLPNPSRPDEYADKLRLTCNPSGPSSVSGAKKSRRGKRPASPGSQVEIGYKPSKIAKTGS